MTESKTDTGKKTLDANLEKNCLSQAKSFGDNLTNLATTHPKDFSHLVKQDFNVDVWFDNKGHIGGFAVPYAEREYSLDDLTSNNGRFHYYSDQNLSSTINNLVNHYKRGCITRD